MTGTSSRRRILLAGGAMAAAGVGVALLGRRGRRQAPKVETAAANPRAKRPNILLIMSDQERHWSSLPGDLSLPGHDLLREGGVSFANYHVHTTPCSPSRSTFYFGQHTQHTKMVVNHGAPPFPEVPNTLVSLGDLFRAQGYYTAYKGKWHLSHIGGNHNLTYGPFPNTSDELEPFGFSDFNIDGDPHGATWTGFRYDGQIAADASIWLKDNGRKLSDEGKPWLLAVNFVNPHDIMYFSSGDDQVRSRIDPNMLAPISRPPVGGVYDNAWPGPLPESFYKADIGKRNWSQRSYAAFCDMIYGRFPQDDETVWRDNQSYYFNCLRDVDHHTSTVLARLKTLGLDDNTIVIYLSDHGEMAGAQKLRQKGPHIFRENIHVPLIIRHPDVKTGSGSETSALASPIDMIPTLLSWAGVDDAVRRTKYPYLKGIDVSSAVTGASSPSERDRLGILYNYGVAHYWDPVYTEKAISHHTTADKLFLIRQIFNTGEFFPSLENPGLFRGVFDGRYKFARYFRPSQHHIPNDFEMLKKYNELELYDTQNDPHELNNLALQPDAVKDELMRLSTMTNELIAREIGTDDGREFTGPRNWYKLTDKLPGSPA